MAGEELRDSPERDLRRDSCGRALVRFCAVVCAYVCKYVSDHVNVVKDRDASSARSGQGVQNANNSVTPAPRDAPFGCTWSVGSSPSL